MPADQQKILASVFRALDEFNQGQPDGHQVAKAPESVLLGANSPVDSLGLVNLLITVEQQVNTDFDTALSLASDKAFSMRNSPFASVASLTAYIETLLEETNA